MTSIVIISQLDNFVFCLHKLKNSLATDLADYKARKDPAIEKLLIKQKIYKIKLVDRMKLIFQKV